MRFETFPVGMLETNCYIGWAPETGAAFIVDPGAVSDRVFQFVEQQGLKPEAILLTHGHFDHIMGIEGWRKAYPRLEVYASSREQEMLADPDLNMTCRFPGHHLQITPDYLLEDGQVFRVCQIPMRFLHTPGHTSGSGCFLVEREDYQGGVPVLFSGDTLFRGSCGRTDFETGSMEDMIRSLQRLMKLDKDTIALPGHGEPTEIAWEARFNPFVRG